MLKLIQTFDEGESLVELPDGSRKFIAHGIFGSEASRAYEEGQPINFEEMSGEPFLRFFETKEAAEAYWQGVHDSNGWENYVATTFEKHAPYLPEQTPIA